MNTESLHRHYINMLCALYSDIASVYPAQYKVEHVRDVETLVSRFEHEGVNFLTKVLPSLAKAIDIALATGTVLQVPSFARKKGSKLPRFLGWLIGQVFSPLGEELKDSNPVALVHLRQLLYLFYKLEMPYTDELVDRFIDQFESVDDSLNTTIMISDPDHRKMLANATNICSRVLAGCATDKLNPKHGPGSVATGERGHEKPYFKRYYHHLHKVYAYDEYMFMNASHQSSRLTETGLSCFDPIRDTLLPPEELGFSTAKVVLVPKDSRGPRLISMEPLEIQWLQQGQCERLVKRLESHSLTKGHVNFSNQDINRYLAHFSSCDPSNMPKTWGPHSVEVIEPPCYAKPKSRDLVTIDMKEASDRVSIQLLYALFPSNWIEALEATRSSHTMLPSGRVRALNKFAPMGSAVCFPVEAFLFFALAVGAVMHKHSCSMLKARHRVWVYGDDIICHREDYPVIRQILELVGLKLNESKCCTAGFFRESCGVDSYKGIIVTPLRIKKCVSHRPDGQSIMAYAAYSNAAFRYGYTNLAEYLEKYLASVAIIPYTTVDRGTVQFVRPHANVSYLNKLHNIRTRFNPNTHVLEARGFTPRAVISSGHRVTYETYFCKFMSSNVSDGAPPNPDAMKIASRALEPDQYSVPRRISSRRGWTQISL